MMFRVYSTYIVVSICVLTTFHSFAIAQTEDDADREARALFDAGEVAYANGQLDRALGHFQRAYELSRRPLLLYNIASVLDRLRRDQEALEAYERFLELQPDSDRAAFVEQRIAQLQNQLAESEAAAPTQPESADPPVLSGGEDDASGPPAEGLALLVTGSALLLGAAGTLVWTVVANDRVTECGQLGCLNPSDFVTERDVALGLTIGLGVLGLTGIVLGSLLVAAGRDEDPQELSVRCLPTFGGLSCAGRF